MNITEYVNIRNGLKYVQIYDLHRLSKNITKLLVLFISLPLAK